MLRGQKYSDLVFKEVEAVSLSLDEKYRTKYKSLCKRAGGIFRTVGLLQFMAFIDAKGRKEKQYADLGEHLRSELCMLNLVTSSKLEPFLRELRQAQLPEYMHLSRCVLDLLQWHKRISEIMIAGEADEYEGEG
ncbi:type III-B CRISPR module-associated protein Cmr5 [Maridesulfovibrio sp.]|uniref:type III-B CRISPR module-associated protein Cmr5 n=1 Tax=unclassified Maridesulfovibrio TaxID=2794999 RepID=UPI003AFFE0F9